MDMVQMFNMTPTSIFMGSFNHLFGSVIPLLPLRAPVCGHLSLQSVSPKSIQPVFLQKNQSFKHYQESERLHMWPCVFPRVFLGFFFFFCARVDLEGRFHSFDR